VGRLARALVVALALLAPASAEASSPFQYRGVVEGFYGTPYTHAERLRMLAFMAAHGLNTYVEAPKDDPHQRLYWREPYGYAELARFGVEIAYARSHGILFVPSLSPGIPKLDAAGDPGHPPDASVCFSCQSDVTALVQKFVPLFNLGVRTFMLSFDDVKRELPYPQDQQAFGSGDAGYGRANAYLLNAFLAAMKTLDPKVRVLTVGAVYAGTSDGDYLKAMRKNLSPEIEMMWTGRKVRSRQFTPDDARRWTALAGRQPIVWENWANQDHAPSRLFMGTWQGDVGLAGRVKGFVLNAPFVPEAGFVPFDTAARWMAAPGKYDARRAFVRTTKELAGPRAGLLRAFAEANYSSTQDPRSEAPTFVRLSERLLRAADSPAVEPAARALLGELKLVIRAKKLRRTPLLAPLVDGERPFFKSAARQAKAGALATKYVLARSRFQQAKERRAAKKKARRGPLTGAQRKAEERARTRAIARIRALRGKLVRLWGSVRANPVNTYGNRMAWRNLRFGNVMDRYLKRVLKRTWPAA
jgi:hyaluronoglucosaminidase